MWRNTFYDTKKSIMYFWETIKDKNLYDSVEWVPNVYVNDGEGKVKSIDNKLTSIKRFNYFNEYYKFCESNEDCYENNVKSEIQFLANRYYGISDDEMEVPKLRIFYLDIEVHSETELGFPHADIGEFPVVLISIYDSIENKTTTYGIKPYSGEYKDKDFFNYVYCETEEKILTNVFNHFAKKKPDVISGWNVRDFDIQYLINRSKKVFGEDTDIYRRMSPIGVVRTWKSNSGMLNIDIAGVCILDYMQLYKWYSPDKLERYSLQFVSLYELEKTKVDYSAITDDLRELYNKDWNLYVKYNVIDTYRVYQLEEKLGYIKLVQALSLLCKAPMKYFNSMVQLIEGYLLTFYRRKNLCAPKFIGGQQGTFDAAFVKEPQVNRYDWVIDIDIISSYPIAVITMNMSIETFYGRIKDMTEQEILYCVRQKEFDDFTMINSSGEVKKIEDKSLELFNKALNKRLICIAPCGSIFTTNKQGVLAEATKELFAKRIEIKNKMIKLKKSLPELRGENISKIKEKIAQLDSHQKAIKIILNAIFGITAVPYSRYFNMNIAEAIVSCGRHTRASGEKFVNMLLNEHNDDIQKIVDQIKIDLKDGK